MKRWQSYSRPNFRSQLILSEFFASQTAIKKCLNTRVLTTLYYMRWYMLIGPFKCSQLRSRVRELGPLVLRSTNPLLPTLRFSVIKIQIFHSRRLNGEETWQQEQAKKSTGQSFHRACSCRFCWTGPAAMIVVALRAEDCFKKKKHWTVAKRTLHLHIINDRADNDIIGTRSQPKLTKLWTKTCNRCPHRQRVTFQAGHAESTIPLNSENWVHELLIPLAQVQYYPPAPTNMKKHLRVTSDEEKLVSLPCEWVLIDHGFRDRMLQPGAPARKEVFETALEGPARTQSDVFLVFSRTGNPLVKTVFLRGQRKLTKNSSTNFTLLATIVTIVAEQLNFDAQEAQYTTKTTTPVATESDEEYKQNSEFSLVYFLALFLSRFKGAFCQRSLRQRRDALKSLGIVSHFTVSRASGLLETAARPGRAKIVAEISCFCSQRGDLSSMHALVVDVRACFNFFGQGSTTLAKKIETGTHVKLQVRARACARWRVAVPIFLARVVHVSSLYGKHNVKAYITSHFSVPRLRGKFRSHATLSFRDILAGPGFHLLNKRSMKESSSFCATKGFMPDGDLHDQAFSIYNR